MQPSYEENESMLYSEGEQIFDGVDMAQSITCSSHEQQTKPKFMGFYQGEAGQQCGTQTSGSKNLSDYERSIDFFVENQLLRKENEKLKRKIRESQLATSMKKTRGSENDANLINSKAKVRTRFGEEIDNEDIEKFQFVESFSRCSSNLEKIRSLIILEEFCSVKVMEAELNNFLSSLDSTIDEFSRQKKGYEKEIKNLKVVNQNLFEMFFDMEQKLDNLILKVNSTPISKPGNEPRTNEKFNSETQIKRPSSCSPSFGSEMPYFARTFSHSIDEIEFLAGMQEELSLGTPESQTEIQAIVKLSYCLRQKLVRNQRCDIDPVSLVKSDRVKEWLRQIQEKINSREFSQHTSFLAKRETSKEKRNPEIQEFLNCLQKCMPKFLKKLSEVPQKQNFLMNILLTSYISFIEIYFTEFKLGGILPSTGQEYIGKFWRLLNTLKMRSGLEVSEEIQNYLGDMEGFLSSITEDDLS